jgi:hypothetical protein
MPSSTTTQSRYSKQIKKMQDKINKLENEINRIEQKKPAFSFSKINSKTLKNIGFKSKTIAKKFAILSDIKLKDYNNEQVFLNVLKNKLTNFQKLGLKFDAIKYIDTSTEKVKNNKLIKQENKNLEIEKHFDTMIKSKKQQQKKQPIVPYVFDSGIINFMYNLHKYY